MRRLLIALTVLLCGFTPPQDTAPTYEVPAAPVLSIWSEEPSVSQYYWTAATGSVDDWTMRVSAGSPSLAIVDDGGVQALRFRQGTQARAAASFDLLDNNADVEILTYTRTNILGNSSQLGHWGRGSGSLTTNIYGLIAVKRGGSTSQRGMEIYRYINGTYTQYAEGNAVADASLTDPTQYHWRKTQISGTTFRAKAWAGLVTDEPAGWGLETTQSDLTVSGWAGLFAFIAADNYYQIFAIGTGGSPAPTEPLASGVTLTAPADTTTQTQPITFSWEAVSGATAYQLQIATDDQYTNIVHDDDTLTTTSKEVSGLAAATLHYWRVRADI